MTIGRIMSGHVVTVDIDASLTYAACLMADHGVGMLVVEEKGKLIGTLTERDLCVNAIALGHDPNRATVAEAFNRDVITCSRDEDVERAAQHMQQHKVRRIVVMEGTRPCGVMSIGDLARSADDAKLTRKTLEAVS